MCVTGYMGTLFYPYHTVVMVFHQEVPGFAEQMIASPGHGGDL